MRTRALGGEHEPRDAATASEVDSPLSPGQLGQGGESEAVDDVILNWPGAEESEPPRVPM